MFADNHPEDWQDRIDAMAEAADDLRKAEGEPRVPRRQPQPLGPYQGAVDAAIAHRKKSLHEQISEVMARIQEDAAYNK